ncbi:MAG: Response regulator receiver protein [Pedosphaera sp.]|nr:Response regulator receiver protein [Pedosphaera sp.]
MAELFEILLVEDYEPDVQLVLRLFRKNRIANKLHVVHDGIQAMDFVLCRGAFRERTFGVPSVVVIMDIRLPKVDGWEVLRQMRLDPRTRGISVVVISGSLFPEELEKSRRLGANATLSKPIRLESLRDALARSGFTLTTLQEKQT